MFSREHFRFVLVFHLRVSMGLKQRHPHSPTLDTRRKTQAGTTQEHLAWDCARGAEDPTAHLGNHSEAGPEQTGVVILCCCPTYLTAFMGMSE